MNVPHSVMEWADLANHAYSVGLKPELLLAMIWQESAGDQDAWNPEPRYRWFWDVGQNRPFRQLSREEIVSEVPPSDFPCLRGDRDQEWWAQQASWGLMQIMGAVGREHGFKGPYLTRLCCDPELNIQIGANHLLKQMARVNGDIRAGLLRYNGGGNPGYPDEVYAKMEILS